MTRHALALFGLSSLAVVSAAAAPEARPVRLLVPAYFYPADEGLAQWKRLIAAADKVPVVAIVNPASGPGARADENYREVFRLARGSKLTTIGYVTLSYAKRPAAEVNAEVDRWRALYPEIQGIFFDEQPSGADGVAFARACFAHARARFPKGVLVSNPGTTCDTGYAADPDGPAVCLFENHAGFDAFRAPDWARKAGPGRVAVLVYGVAGREAMARRFREAVARGAGLVLVTDPPKDPWLRLPSYWADEVAEAAAANRPR